MEKYSEVLGLPVICLDTGKKVGTIKDVIFSPKDREVKAFLLERKGCQVRKKVILLKDVTHLGKDIVVVADCSLIKDFRKADELKDRRNLTGLKIYSKTGQDLGIVKDILFDYRNRRIEGIEVSDGLLQDIVQGRNILPLFGRVEFSDEFIVVDKEATEEMVNTGGGLKKKLLE
ncbi:MAG: PRC-barrel domain-containing protein [Clostridia bacterium]|nr:PRC-barrel domain-containing protein [Clostridia bacterium]